ncbi:uncharacterized protein JCM10292_002311 [Rhodotorula paludigena]|uniref:uncharacterized protein n=1 Tax=Rhodotorula paludigena TaxID=86838 RepID=UPI0031747E8E
MADSAASSSSLAQRRGMPRLTQDRQRRPRSHHRKRFKPAKHLEKGWTAASFHFSLCATFLAIGVVWAITPLSWIYVFYTLVTLSPSLSSARPAPASSPSAFRVLHYVCLAYCCVECAFSIYYRYLAIRCQRLRPPPRHSRKFLRALFLRSLENGLTLEEELEIEEADLRNDKRGTKGDDEWKERTARDEEEAARGSDTELSLPVRRRARGERGDGAATPELRTTDLPGASNGDYLSARNLPTLRTDDAPASRYLQPARSRASLDSRDEGFGGDISRLSLNTLDSAMGASPRSYTAPILPLVSHPDANGTQHKHRSKHGSGDTDDDGHPHPHTRFLPRLSPSDPRAQDFRELLRYWMNGCDFSEIGRLDMLDWIAWAMYGEPLEALEAERKEWDKAGRPPLFCRDGVTLDVDPDLDDSPSEREDGDGSGAGEAPTRAEERLARVKARREESVDCDRLGLVHHCLTLVQARAAHVFPPGRNARVRPLRLTLDPLRVTGRPLLLYVVVGLLQKAVMGRAITRGFRRYDDDGTRYLVRKPDGWEPREDLPEDERPLVFLHGLGMGLAQYTTLVSVLSKSRALRRRPILILLQPHISMSFFSKGYLDPVEQEGCTKGLERVLRKHRFDERAGGCTVLSHSNGTIVHGWLIKDCPSLVIRSCFVDPVAFQLYEPWVCFNALYAPTRKPMEYLMRYYVMRELGVAYMLQRTFSWTSNLLWPSEIPNVSDAHKTAIFLASDDSILAADRVRIYLRRNGLREVRAPARVGEEPGAGGLKVFEGLKHGESMIGEGAPFEEVLRWVTWDAGDPSAYETGASSESASGNSSSGGGAMRSAVHGRPAARV